jgi:hypothetical protein
LCLDIAFVLIDGHPESLYQFLGVDVLEWYNPSEYARHEKKRGRVGHPPKGLRRRYGLRCLPSLLNQAESPVLSPAADKGQDV